MLLTSHLSARLKALLGHGTCTLRRVATIHFWQPTPRHFRVENGMAKDNECGAERHVALLRLGISELNLQKNLGFLHRFSCEFKSIAGQWIYQLNLYFSLESWNTCSGLMWNSVCTKKILCEFCTQFFVSHLGQSWSCITRIQCYVILLNFGNRPSEIWQFMGLLYAFLRKTIIFLSTYTVHRCEQRRRAYWRHIVCDATRMFDISWSCGIYGWREGNNVCLWWTIGVVICFQIFIHGWNVQTSIVFVLSTVRNFRKSGELHISCLLLVDIDLLTRLVFVAHYYQATGDSDEHILNESWRRDNTSNSGHFTWRPKLSFLRSHSSSRLLGRSVRTWSTIFNVRLLGRSVKTWSTIFNVNC